MTVKLSKATLQNLPKNVGVPGYSQSGLKAGIIHFGIGNFHRAHQAVYLDELFNAGIDHEWGLVGAGVLASDETMRQKLQAQDWLTTVVEQDSGHRTAHVTASMIDYLQPGDTANTIARLADPEIRIVSLTITEGGYFIDPASGVFNPQHPAIVSDAANIKDPSTVFGLILAGLMRRRDEGSAPFTVMSCDNIPGNGHVTCSASQWSCRGYRSEFGSVGQGPGRFSQQHGRSHYACHDRPGEGIACDGFRCGGQLASFL